MNQLQVGFSLVNINPPLGLGVAGYYIPRVVEGFLDDVEARALAIACGDTRVVMVSTDICYYPTDVSAQYRKDIAAAVGIPMENLFITATHTHTSGLIAPAPGFDSDENLIKEYSDFLKNRLADAVTMALNDLKPAKMGFAVGRAPEKVAYIRRYKMKDGSTMTCPPVNDPNIDYPLGTLDQRVHVLRFDREGEDSIVLVNYGLHADTVNGSLVSPDWPGWMYKTVSKSLDGTKCIFFYGSAGDVGSTNVHVKPGDGDMNDTEISFDNEMKSPGMARFVGRALAGTVLQVYDKVQYTDVDTVRFVHKDIPVPANVPTPEELALARKYKALHDAGRDDEIPFKAMELTTVVAEATRMCKLANGPAAFNLGCMGIRLGNVAFVGIPGEPFTDIGVAIKDTDGWDMIMPCALTNGHEGYFPTRSAYAEGGYEARSSRYKAGVSDRIIAGAKEILAELKK